MSVASLRAAGSFKFVAPSVRHLAVAHRVGGLSRAAEPLHDISLTEAGSLHRAGLVLGVGLGGFVDGILLHQILQWHHLVCTTATCEVHTLAEFKRQTLQDGLFHLAMLLVTITGVAMLFRAAARRTRVWTTREFVGSILTGWGCFNLVEGVIDHHILGIHHVIAGSRYELAADLAFLGISLAMAILGGVLRRNGRRHVLP